MILLLLQTGLFEDIYHGIRDAEVVLVCMSMQVQSPIIKYYRLVKHRLFDLVAVFFTT